MAALSAIPKITKLSSRIIRILGCNPSHTTLQGTNTYLIGNGPERILIDAGQEGFPEYLSLLKQVLSEHDCTIKEMVLTHWHHDHIGGVSDVVKSVVKSNCKISKFPRRSQEDVPLGNDLKYTFVSDTHVFKTEGANLRAIYSPGHTDDHMSLLLEEENALFTGDCVLGEGTAVFEDLFDYMKSLDKLRNLKPNIIYPAHGAVVQEPVRHITNYIDHRNQRESQIYAALKGNDALTAMEIVKRVYVGTPEILHPAAAANVTHHLEKLTKEGQVKKETNDRWRVSNSSL